MQLICSNTITYNALGAYQTDAINTRKPSNKLTIQDTRV